MKYKLLKFCVVLVLSMITYSCAPLRKVNKEEYREQVITDNSIAELVKTEIQRQIGTISQTTIEFYPEINKTNVDTFLVVDTDNIPKVSESTLRPKKPPSLTINQPIKKIITTQVDVETDNIKREDRVSVSDIIDVKDTDYKEETNDKPSGFSTSIKWIAIILAIILLIIIILKFR